MMILGIDPGLHTGAAMVKVTAAKEILLIGADLTDARSVPVGSPGSGTQVVIEKPVIYPHARENPNDLLTLAIQVGNYQEHFRHRGFTVTLVEARTWKGQVPKTVTERRVCAKFENARAILDRFPPSLRHNVSDAIGLAWWHACRFAR